jgi:hypothetical protein
MPPIETPDRRLLKLLRLMPASDVQNRLMRITDREIAVSLLYLVQEERAFVLSFLGGAKRRRVEEEIEYTDRMRIRYPQYRVMIESVISQLGGSGGGPVRSYLRPIRD